MYIYIFKRLTAVRLPPHQGKAGGKGYLGASIASMEKHKLPQYIYPIALRANSVTVLLSRIKDTTRMLSTCSVKYTIKCVDGVRVTRIN